MASIAELKKDFQKLIKGNNLAHGYLFFGHESAVERLAFAKELANHFENKKWASAEKPLLDCRLIDAREEGGIDFVREASHFLWQKPVVSPKRTLIVDRADELTLPAQNALLKITEEPPPHALILLLARNPEALLTPVQSRFQKVFVAVSDRSRDISEAAKDFLRASTPARKAIIKELLESERYLDGFVADLISELRRDKMKNWRMIKNLLHRWSMIKQFNTNKRLQLEAALLP